jgi:hypothetical protein
MELTGTSGNNPTNLLEEPSLKAGLTQRLILSPAIGVMRFFKELGRRI